MLNTILVDYDRKLNCIDSHLSMLQFAALSTKQDVLPHSVNPGEKITGHTGGHVLHLMNPTLHEK